MCKHLRNAWTFLERTLCSRAFCLFITLWSLRLSWKKKLHSTVVTEEIALRTLHERFQEPQEHNSLRSKKKRRQPSSPSISNVKRHPWGKRIKYSPKSITCTADWRLRECTQGAYYLPLQPTESHSSWREFRSHKSISCASSCANFSFSRPHLHWHASIM